MDQCPFCQILQDDAKKQIIKRGVSFTAIRKLYTSKNVNFLVISNQHIPNLKDGHPPIDMNELVRFINELSEGKDWSLKISNGSESGQDVFHFHAHIFSFAKPDTWGI